MSLLYFFPWFKHNFSFTFSIEICFWWLQTSENNYSAGLFLSRFNRKMSFYQPLNTKTNSSSKVACSLRFIRIHISLRGKTKEYLFDFPLLGEKKKLWLLTSLSFCSLIYCSNISPQKYVFAIHCVLLSLMSLIESQRTQHDLSVCLWIAEIMHMPCKSYNNIGNISWYLSLAILFSTLRLSFNKHWQIFCPALYITPNIERGKTPQNLNPRNAPSSLIQISSLELLSPLHCL